MLLLQTIQMFQSRRMRLLGLFVVVLLPGMVSLAKAACMPPGGCSVALASFVYNSTTDGNLSTVAQRFQASKSDILWYSKLNSSSTVSSGQSLRIPFVCGCPDSQLEHIFLYTVVTGDTADTIASDKYRFLTTWNEMTEANHKDLNFLYPQNVLFIPVHCFCGDPDVDPSYGLFLTYVAEDNDNAASLSRKFNVSVDLLQKYNQNVSLNLLTGSASVLFIPVQDGNGVYPRFNSTGLRSSKNTKAIVGASIGSVLFLAIAGIVLLYLYIYRPKRRREASKKSKYQSSATRQDPRSEEAKMFSGGSSYSNTTMGGVSSGLSFFSPDRSFEFSYKELSNATDNFSNAQKIGQGGYGSVFYGELHGQKLAIKMMNMQATKEFLSELQVLTRVHHTNLVRLVGYCTHESLFVVYEYMDNGTLSDHLKVSRREGTTSLSWDVRIQVALDAARGLEYIHEHTTPTYIHRDIKSSNILLDRNCRAKVADFGLTKLTESGTGSNTLPSRLVGTFGYMAPEYARFGDISAKSDVYSFGVVLFEIISAKDAIVHLDKDSETQASRVASQGLVTLFDEVLSDSVNGKEKLRSLVDGALGDDYPIESVWKMAMLAADCTKENPLDRPNMRGVVVSLMTLSTSTQEWETDRGMPGFLTAR